MTHCLWAGQKSPLTAATARFWRGKHVVYRHVRGDGSLLYVGMTFDLYERTKAHRRLAAWWSDVDRVVVEVYGSRAEAHRAERDAIATEKPPNNAPIERRLPAPSTAA